MTGLPWQTCGSITIRSFMGCPRADPLRWKHTPLRNCSPVRSGLQDALDVLGRHAAVEHVLLQGGVDLRLANLAAFPRGPRRRRPEHALDVFGRHAAVEHVLLQGGVDLRLADLLPE